MEKGAVKSRSTSSRDTRGTKLSDGGSGRKDEGDGGEVGGGCRRLTSPGCMAFM